MTLSSVQWLAVSICLCICQSLVKPHKRQQYQAPVSKHLLASAVLSGFSFMWSVSCILNILRFLSIIHLSVSSYHVSSFVIRLPHSGWYLKFHAFAWEFHEVIVFNSWVVFPCVNVPHFLYPFFCWKTSRLFPAYIILYYNIYCIIIYINIIIYYIIIYIFSDILY